MEYISISPFPENLARIALGTSSMGRLFSENTEDAEELILKALEHGINIIDTAPIYGMGRAESIIGQTLKKSNTRSKVYISTKCGIRLQNSNQMVRDLSPDFILHNLETSLKRLETSYIDIYHVDCPDPLVPIQDTAELMRSLLGQGKIRAVGLNHFNPKQMEAFRAICPIHFCQSPYNIFEREIENGLFEYCQNHRISLMTYSSLCKDLLSGQITKDHFVQEKKPRQNLDPKFQPPYYREYLSAVWQLDHLAKKKFNKSVLDLSIRWILDQGVPIAIWEIEKPHLIERLQNIFGWKVDRTTSTEIDHILKTSILYPQSSGHSQLV